MTQREYDKQWQQFQNGHITREQWVDYCTQFLYTFLATPEVVAILTRMKVNDESNQVQAMVR